MKIKEIKKVSPKVKEVKDSKPRDPSKLEDEIEENGRETFASFTPGTRFAPRQFGGSLPQSPPSIPQNPPPQRATRTERLYDTPRVIEEDRRKYEPDSMGWSRQGIVRGQTQEQRQGLNFQNQELRNLGAQKQEYEIKEQANKDKPKRRYPWEA